MPDADLAKLFATHLDKIPTPDGRELRFLHYSTFGQADDVKARITNLAQEVGTGLVHLARQNNWTFTHPSDPAPEIPTGKRIAALKCPDCQQVIARLPLDGSDVLTPNSAALQALLGMKHHCHA